MKKGKWDDSSDEEDGSKPKKQQKKSNIKIIETVEIVYPGGEAVTLISKSSSHNSLENVTIALRWNR